MPIQSSAIDLPENEGLKRTIAALRDRLKTEREKYASFFTEVIAAIDEIHALAAKNASRKDRADRCLALFILADSSSHDCLQELTRTSYLIRDDAYFRDADKIPDEQRSLLPLLDEVRTSIRAIDLPYLAVQAVHETPDKARIDRCMSAMNRLLGALEILPILPERQASHRSLAAEVERISKLPLDDIEEILQKSKRLSGSHPELRARRSRARRLLLFWSTLAREAKTS